MNAMKLKRIKVEIENWITESNKVGRSLPERLVLLGKAEKMLIDLNGKLERFFNFVDED